MRCHIAWEHLVLGPLICTSLLLRHIWQRDSFHAMPRYLGEEGGGTPFSYFHTYIDGEQWARRLFL